MAEPFFKGVEESADESPESRLGRSLRYEREKRNLTAKDVARQLCLSVSLIQKLEAGDVDALPEPVYVRGYVRAYCKLLGVDPAPLLEGVVFKPAGDEEDDFLPAMNEQIHRLTRLWGSFTVLAIIVLLVSFWWMEQPRGIKEHVPPPPAPPPETFTPSPFDGSTFPNPATDAPGMGQEFSEPAFEAPPATVADDEPEEAVSEPPAAVEEAQITIYVPYRSWARVSDGSGRVLVERILPADYTATVYGVFPLDFSFGDARDARVWVDGLEQDVASHVGRLNTAFFTIDKPFQ